MPIRSNVIERKPHLDLLLGVGLICRPYMKLPAFQRSENSVPIYPNQEKHRKICSNNVSDKKFEFGHFSADWIDFSVKRFDQVDRDSFADQFFGWFLTLESQTKQGSVMPGWRHAIFPTSTFPRGIFSMKTFSIIAAKFKRSWLFCKPNLASFLSFF